LSATLLDLGLGRLEEPIMGHRLALLLAPSAFRIGWDSRDDAVEIRIQCHAFLSAAAVFG
jgi:hypothetical protein